MARIIVHLREAATKRDGTAPVVMHINIKFTKVVLSTGVYVKPDKWNSESLKIKGNTKEVNDDNLIISNCISRVNDIIVRYRLQNKQLTPQLLKKEYKNPSAFLDFYEFCKRELELKKGVDQPATIKAHNSAIEKMKGYRKSLMFSEIDYEFIEEFYKHMKVTLKNNDNTAAKTLTVIKSYLNKAVKKRIIEKSPYPEDIKLKKSATSRVYLSPDEFKKLVDIYRRKLLQENLQKTLRYFLFSCCVGLRVSDVKSITWNNVNGDVLIYSPVKTRGHGKLVRVPLCNLATELMGLESMDRNKRVFECYSDQVTNRYLKDIADKCGIDKKISSHSGRHTFATLFLRHSKNIAGLKELMGHSNIAQTMVYAHIIYEDLKTDMDIFDILSAQ